MAKFEYKERTPEQIKQRLSQKSFSREGFLKDFPIFAPKAGETNRIRILPPTWEGSSHYGIDVFVHYNIGADNSAYLCLKRMKKEKCPICEELATPAMKEDKTTSYSIREKRKVLVWVIDRKDEEAGPKLWAMPYSKVDNEIVLQANDEDTGSALRVDHHKEGYDVSFSTPKGVGDIAFTYEGVKISRHQSPIFADPKKIDSVLNFIVENPLPSVLIYKDYEYINNIFNAAATTDRGDEPTIPDRKYENAKTMVAEVKPETAKEIVEEQTKEQDFTYEDINKWEREDLEMVATEKGNVPEDEITDYTDEELVKTVAEALGIEVPKPSKKNKSAQLDELKKKYKLG